MRDQKQVLITDTTMRDGHQSLLATRMRSIDMVRIAPAYAANLAGALAPGGTLVTYGAMSLQPLTIPNGPLIFGELRLQGFWVTAWYHRSSREQAATAHRHEDHVEKPMGLAEDLLADRALAGDDQVIVVRVDEGRPGPGHDLRQTGLPGGERGVDPLPLRRRHQVGAPGGQFHGHVEAPVGVYRAFHELLGVRLVGDVADDARGICAPGLELGHRVVAATILFALVHWPNPFATAATASPR